MFTKVRNVPHCWPVSASMEGATAEFYRREAIRVRGLADAAASEALRIRLLEIAEEYEPRAERLEQGKAEAPPE